MRRPGSPPTKTSGLAAGIVTEDAAAAAEFLTAYTGTGAFWNATTRLLDGFKLFAVPETGISIDRVPGPRGPVTFRDLYLRQVGRAPRRSRAPKSSSARASRAQDTRVSAHSAPCAGRPRCIPDSADVFGHVPSG